jgi:hypothetical protein
MDYEAQLRRERFELHDPLDAVHMSDTDREQFRVTMQQAEWIADFLVFAWHGAKALVSRLARPSPPALQRTTS